MPQLKNEKPLLWIHILLVAPVWLGAVMVTVDSMVMGGFLSASTEFRLSFKYGLSFITEQDLHFDFLTSAFLMTGLFSTVEGVGILILFPIWTILLGRWILSARTAAA